MSTDRTMTEQEKLVYAAAFASAYKERFEDGCAHEVCAAYAVKVGYMVAEALHVVPDLLAINQKKWDAEVAQGKREFEEHGRVISEGKHILVEAAYVDLFNEFMK